MRSVLGTGVFNSDGESIPPLLFPGCAKIFTYDYRRHVEVRHSHMSLYIYRNTAHHDPQIPSLYDEAVLHPRAYRSLRPV